MSTRGTIALEFADGSVSQVYAHWDNYISGTGATLLKHYMDPFKVKTLVELGNISSLGSEIGEKHIFSKYDAITSEELASYEKAHELNWTTFYTRDRGEELAVERFPNFDMYTYEFAEQDYNYILRNVNGKATWFYKQEGGQVWHELAVAVATQQRAAAVAA